MRKRSKLVVPGTHRKYSEIYDIITFVSQSSLVLGCPLEPIETTQVHVLGLSLPRRVVWSHWMNNMVYGAPPMPI